MVNMFILCAVGERENSARSEAPRSLFSSPASFKDIFFGRTYLDTETAPGPAWCHWWIIPVKVLAGAASQCSVEEPVTGYRKVSTVIMA